jgi:hypothetical protein
MSTDANASVTSMRQARRSRPAAESGPGQTMADVTARAHVARPSVTSITQPWAAGRDFVMIVVNRTQPGGAR